MTLNRNMGLPLLKILIIDGGSKVLDQMLEIKTPVITAEAVCVYSLTLTSD